MNPLKPGRRPEDGLRLLHVSNRITPLGGAERTMELHREVLRDAGHQVFIASGEEAAPDYEPHAHLLPARMGLRDALDGGRRIADLARHHDVDLIHVYNMVDFLGPRSLAIMNRCRPTVRTLFDVRPTCIRETRVHPRDGRPCEIRQGISCLRAPCFERTPRARGKWLLRRWVDNLLGLRSSRSLPLNIVYSDYMRDLLRAHGFGDDRVRVLTHHVDVPGAPAPGPPLPSSEPRTVVAAGRLDESKGVVQLVQVAALLRDHEIRFELFGDGPFRSQMEEDVARLGLGDRVQVHGRASDEELGQALRRAGMVVVAPRVLETLSRIGIEGNLAGRPVVAYGGGGLSQWLVHDVNGLLVEFGDPKALAAAILQLANDPARATQLGQEGWKRMKAHFTRERQAEDLQAAYRDAIRSWPRGAGGARPDPVPARE